LNQPSWGCVWRRQTYCTAG